MQIALRPASTQDFEYCKRLYFAGMKKIIGELHLNMAAQAFSLREQWALTQVRIINVATVPTSAGCRAQCKVMVFLLLSSLWMVLFSEKASAPKLCIA